MLKKVFIGLLKIKVLYYENIKLTIYVHKTREYRL